MKYFTHLFALLIITSIFFSCQKDFAVNFTDAIGVLVKDTSGNCAPISIGGTFTTNNALTNVNFMEVQVNFEETGTYSISSDTINGYFFHSAGTITATGVNTIRMQGSGTPLVIGNNIVTVRYGTTSCTANIQVTSNNAAVFTVGSPAGNCSAAVVGGSYTVNTALAPANTITIQVNVTVIGSFNISTNIVNGISFNKTGTFTTTGLQTVVLIGSGMPTVMGNNIVSVIGVSGCSISVTVNALTGSVFIAGQMGGKAVLWKDGVPMFLNTAVNSLSDASDVTVVGNDVYVLGSEEDSITTDLKFIIWKNGVRSIVPYDSAFECFNPQNLAVQNNNVYFTYQQYGSGIFTRTFINKNGVSTLLPHGIYAGSRPLSLKIYQNDVYVFASADTVWTTGGVTYYSLKAIYWKNGQYFPEPYNNGEFGDGNIDNTGNPYFTGSSRLRINPAIPLYYYDIATLYRNGNFTLFNGWTNNFIASRGLRTCVDNSTGDIYIGGVYNESSVPNTQGIGNLVYWKGANKVNLTNYNPSLNIVNPLNFIDITFKNNKVYSLVYDDRNSAKYFYYENNTQVNVLGVSNPNDFYLNKIFVR
jgi:hypothetical protein